jgi:hypothetical protein
MSTQIWDVACFCCGFKLGSNKEKCGQDGLNGKKVKNPPCKWAHTDSNIVSKCFRLAQEKANQEQANEKQEDELRLAIANGDFRPNYDEPLHPVDQADAAIGGFSDEEDSLTPAKRNNEEDSLSTPAKRNNAGAGVEQAAQKKQDDKKEKEKKTRWNCMTRTMFFKCIQKHDPFSSPDKGKVWDKIAQEMQQATRTLSNTPDGDFCVYASGKTLNVFYGRCRDKHKASEDGDMHSGGAGKEDADMTIKEERNQLSACIELERSAKEAVEQKREAKIAFDTIRNGEVNEMVISLAVSNDTVRMKAVKVLASKLRAAKMRKLAWEASNKGGRYTYSDADLRDFEQWRQLRQHDCTLPEDPTDGTTSDSTTASAARGGVLAASIAQMMERMPTAAQLQPPSPQEFAAAFWSARREHHQQTRLSLKDKLAQVDNDLADGPITADEASTFKDQIKKDHYKF